MMRRGRFLLILMMFTLGVLATQPCSASRHGRRTGVSSRLFHRHAHAAKAAHQAGAAHRSSSRLVHQRAIDPERATEIQTALIRSGYLAGAASGHWDAGTEAAMQKLQTDNGWQTRLVPDSRAIIKLGLGPEGGSGFGAGGFGGGVGSGGGGAQADALADKP